MPKDLQKHFVERLKKRLDDEVAFALPIALSGDFEAAEQMIRTVDCDVYGQLALARMYVAAITSLGGLNAAVHDRSRIRGMFERAVALREIAYPTPHTKDESADYDEGRAEARGQVVQEIGFDPSLWPIMRE